MSIHKDLEGLPFHHWGTLFLATSSPNIWEGELVNYNVKVLCSKAYGRPRFWLDVDAQLYKVVQGHSSQLRGECTIQQYDSS